MNAALSHSRGSRASVVRHGVPDKPLSGVFSRLTGRSSRVAGPFGANFSRDRHVLAGSTGRAPVPAFLFNLPHPLHPVASILLKHGALARCGQRSGAAVR